MGLFSLAPNPSPPHGPVRWKQPCSDEGCTFPVSTAPVCLSAGEGAGVTPARQGQQCGLRARWTLYLQHAERVCRSYWFTGPHKEAAVLAYFGEQVFSSGASDVAVVPALIHGWSWRKPECQHRSCQSRLCVCVCNDQPASAHQLPVSIAQRGKGNSATDNFLNSNSSESECHISLQPPFSLFMVLLKWLASLCSLPFPPALHPKVPAGDLFCSLTDSVPQALVACRPIYDLLPDPLSFHLFPVCLSYPLQVFMRNKWTSHQKHTVH